jgi:hypothetical protein
MTVNGFAVDPKIEQWHHDFEQLKRNWAEWCVRNATKYDSASHAWSAFVREQQQLRLKIDLSAE